MTADDPRITLDMLQQVADRMQRETPFNTGDVVWWLTQAGAPEDRGNKRGPTHSAAARLIARERSAGRLVYEYGRFKPCGRPHANNSGEP